MCSPGVVLYVLYVIVIKLRLPPHFLYNNKTSAPTLWQTWIAPPLHVFPSFYKSLKQTCVTLTFALTPTFLGCRDVRTLPSLPLFFFFSFFLFFKQVIAELGRVAAAFQKTRPQSNQVVVLVESGPREGRGRRSTEQTACDTTEFQTKPTRQTLPPQKKQPAVHVRWSAAGVASPRTLRMCDAKDGGLVGGGESESLCSLCVRLVAPPPPALTLSSYPPSCSLFRSGGSGGGMLK